jgi:hypothetical protein
VAASSIADVARNGVSACADPRRGAIAAAATDPARNVDRGNRRIKTWL